MLVREELCACAQLVPTKNKNIIFKLYYISPSVVFHTQLKRLIVFYSRWIHIFFRSFFSENTRKKTITTLAILTSIHTLKWWILIIKLLIKYRIPHRYMKGVTESHKKSYKASTNKTLIFQVLQRALSKPVQSWVSVDSQRTLRWCFSADGTVNWLL